MLSSHIFKFTLAPDRNRENRHQLNLWRAACVVFLLCVATAIVAPAQTFTLLATFEGANGDQPSSLVQGTDGNLYGTTYVGGDPCNNWAGCGTVFKLDPAAGITMLYSFTFPSDWPNGTYPAGPLVLATDGNFYGMTGTIGWQGTVFKIAPGETLTTLYTFCSLPNCYDGAAPDAGLIQGSDGNFYGVTYRGGTGQQLCFMGGVGSGTCGVVFKITPTGKLTTLYSFCSQANCTDGGGPSAALVQATDGNFYGTTNLGGNGCYAYGCGGTLFKITPTGVLTTLHTFCAEPNCADGGGPSAALVQATDGNLYGATGGGGAFGAGTLFKITPTGKLTTLYSFCAQSNCPDGTSPTGLFQATDGKFYGTAVMGGGAPDCPGYPTYSCGTAFNLDTGLPPFVSFVRSFGKVGYTVQILGQGFTGTTSVSFHGTPATFTIKSDTSLTATVPAGASTGFVTVTTPSNTLKSNKIFRVKPQIFSISPTSGPVGTGVVITGESLSRTQAVAVGWDYTFASFTVDSDTQITAIIPAGAVGGPITVFTSGGWEPSPTKFDVTP